MSELHDSLKGAIIKLPNGDIIDLYDHVAKVKESAKSWLNGLVKNDVHHSERLENYLDSLTKKLRANKQLTPEEIFILLLAVYMHDIGYWCDGQIISEGHPTRSKKMILHDPNKYHFEKFPIFNRNFPLIACAVGLVCEGHSSEILLSDITNKFEDVLLNEPDLRKLTALLRLADEIDDVYIRPAPISKAKSFRERIPSVKIGEEIICWCCREYLVTDVEKVHIFFRRKFSLLKDSLQYLSEKKAGDWFIGPCSPNEYYYGDSVNIVSTVSTKKGFNDGLLEILTKSSEFIRIGKFEEGIKYYTNTLTISKTNGEKVSEGWSLSFLGLLHFRIGAVHKAINFFGQALEIHIQTNNLYGEAFTRGSLGNLYINIREYQNAFDCFSRVLEISKITNNLEAEGNVFGNLGIIYSAKGDHKQAIIHYQKSLNLHLQVDNKEFILHDLKNIGDSVFNLKEYQNAVEVYKSALEFVTILNNLEDEWYLLTKIGFAYKLLEEYSEAIIYYNEALALARESSDLFKEGDNLNRLGIAYKNTGEFERSIESLTSALQIHKKISNFRYIANDLGNLGATYVEIGMPYRGGNTEATTKAISLLNQAIELDREIDEPEGEARDLFNLGLAYYNNEDSEKGHLAFSEAKKIFSKLNLPVKVFQIESQEKFYNFLNGKSLF